MSKEKNQLKGDEAACLLRGSDTRTNFIDPSPPNSSLSLKIKNLKLSFTPTKTTIETSSKAFSINTESSSCGLLKKSSEMVHDDDDDDEAYKPDLIFKQCDGGGFDMGCYSFNDQEPKRMDLEGDEMIELGISDDHLDEMKFERGISGSVYAMNEYWGECS
ncbi:hypothetical protein U1Q18_019410 [Sarracenia purpurea var. burkii]